MWNNTIGKRFTVTCFGESHGPMVGVVVDGCPPGIPISEAEIQAELDRRKPGQSWFSSPRPEEDKVEILSGLRDGATTGAPLAMAVRNSVAESKAYEELRWKPRPGHADLPAYLKYGEHHDHRGGGRFSARITAAYVMAGAVAKKILAEKRIEILAHVVAIGGVSLTRNPTPAEIRANRDATQVRCVDPEVAGRMEKAILKAKVEGDSVGGVVECLALNLLPGLGEPTFSSLDSDLARFLFAIPAVKGVEFGAGFKASGLRGSENNDQYRVEGGRVVAETNNAGGILGGLSTGMPLVVRVAFKPPSSIPRPQRTVDLRRMKPVTIEVKGRHDACFVPRAVPIVEGVVASVLADHLLLNYQPGG